MLTDVKTMSTAIKTIVFKKDRSLDLFYYGRNYATLQSVFFFTKRNVNFFMTPTVIWGLYCLIDQGKLRQFNTEQPNRSPVYVKVTTI